MNKTPHLTLIREYSAGRGILRAQGRMRIRFKVIDKVNGHAISLMKSFTAPGSHARRQWGSAMFGSSHNHVSPIIFHSTEVRNATVMRKG